MPSREELEFLALLVHRGKLTHEQAGEAMREAQSAQARLDSTLIRLGWFTREKLEELRKNDGEDLPDVPGHIVIERIGIGGTARVYRARERQSSRDLGGREAGGREVALKILNPELALDALARERFIAEGRLLCDLDHPSIVKGYRVAHFTPRSGGDPVYLLSMELVKGKTLLEHLHAKQSFDEDTALAAVLAAARGLDYLRSRGIVHRDIKPGNLMIGEGGVVKLIDLGFAQSSAAETAASAPADTTVGTVHYLSPEQARGEGDLDVRSDIYSLGVTLFHLVVGELPFQGEAPSEVIRKHVLEGLSSPALKGRRISPHVHYFIEKMMAKEREIRYGSPSELIRDIERTTAGKKSADFKPRR
ncbi:MAG: serine/threonine protein kinase [Planctomycetes bacterium]|nr:serine/threonine protein kinase [Planctomycetota bacterium]